MKWYMKNANIDGVFIGVAHGERNRFRAQQFIRGQLVYEGVPEVPASSLQASSRDDDDSRFDYEPDLLDDFIAEEAAPDFG